MLETLAGTNNLTSNETFSLTAIVIGVQSPNIPNNIFSNVEIKKTQ